MISESVWKVILTARNSSEAVSLASEFSPASLAKARLPWAFEELSTRAKANVLTVCRAIDVQIDSVPCNRWQVWTQTEQDFSLAYGWEEGASFPQQDPSVNSAHGNRTESSVSGSELHDLEQQQSASRTADNIEATLQDVPASVTIEASKTDSSKVEAEKPTIIEVQSARAIREWARNSPHTEPPADALAVIRESKFTANLLSNAIGVEDSPSIRATLIDCFSENITSTCAGEIMKGLIIPYVFKVTAPASRELMQAVVKFADLHWRAAVSLFESARECKNDVNGPSAEVLVRIAEVLNEEAAMRSLSAICSSRWNEDCIRILEALVAKCKTRPGVAGMVVSSMDASISGLESSVRFGKLLFTVVRDVPEIAQCHAQEMETLIRRSRVFLAKRAIRVLHEKIEDIKL